MPERPIKSLLEAAAVVVQLLAGMAMALLARMDRQPQAVGEALAVLAVRLGLGQTPPLGY